MNIQPSINLTFNGECDAAFALYQQCFGAAVTFRLEWSAPEMGDAAPADWRDKVAHATLTMGGTTLHGSDALPAHYERPQGFHLQINLDDADAAERMFAQLADGGRVNMPLQETFWAKRFGSVVDRFGIPWAINCGETDA